MICLLWKVFAASFMSNEDVLLYLRKLVKFPSYIHATNSRRLLLVPKVYLVLCNIDEKKPRNSFYISVRCDNINNIHCIFISCCQLMRHLRFTCWTFKRTSRKAKIRLVDVGSLECPYTLILPSVTYFRKF